MPSSKVISDLHILSCLDVISEQLMKRTLHFHVPSETA